MLFRSVLDGDQIHKDFRPSEPFAESAKHSVVTFNNGVQIEVSGPLSPALQIPALVFTNAGQELQRLMEPSETPAYLSALGVAMRQRGLVAKRGTPIPQADGVSIITFEQDL